MTGGIVSAPSGPPIYFHPAFLDHQQLPGHPECPERLVAIRQRLEREGLWEDVRSPSPLELKDLVRVHEPHYLQRLQVNSSHPYDGDTFLNPETYDIARMAAGATVQATMEAHSHPNRPTLALSRPPGHHAGAGYGGGFCYLNNVALAAQSLLDLGLDRVAIVDLDVHHGNGTADIFAAEPRVLYCSTHGWPLFPGTGAHDDTGRQAGQGYTVNIPLPAGSGDATFAMATQQVLLPVLDRYKPQALLISLGGDTHWADPLASLALSSAGYIQCLQQLSAHARGTRIPLVVTIEGGYHLKANAEVMACCAAILADAQLPPLEYGQVRDDSGVGAGAVARAVEVQRQHWELGH